MRRRFLSDPRDHRRSTDEEFGSRTIARVARESLDHPRRVITVALGLAIVAIFAASSLDGALRTDRTDYDDPGSESVAARQAFTAAVGHSPEPGVLAILTGPAADTEGRTLAKLIGADSSVAAVEVKRGAGGSKGSSRLVVGYFRPQSATEDQEAFVRIRDTVHGASLARLGGAVAFNEDANRISSLDVLRVELVALPLLFLVLALALRSMRLAAVTLGIGVLTILISMLALRLAASLVGISIFAVNLQVALALGLVIDYSLLTVTRVREELITSSDPCTALKKATLPVGRTIFASALVLVAATATLAVFPERFLYSMALAGSFAVLSACAAGLYVLPAVLALKPHWLDGARGRAIATAALDGDNGWFALGKKVRRHPILVATVCVALLLVLIVPFTGLRFTGVNESELPTSAESRQVADQVQRDFPGSQGEAMFMTLPGDAGSKARVLANRIGRLVGVKTVEELRSSAATSVLSIQTAYRALSENAERLSGQIRAAAVADEGELGGLTPAFVDQRKSIEEHLPLVAALLFGGALVLVGVVTRSLVLPVKTFLLNLLTLGATLGVLVLVFQRGNFEGLLGYKGQGAIDLTQPILLSVIAFGLMTDYSIFLLTRIREGYLGGATNDDAVVAGLGHTGRVITWAAVGVCTAIGALVVSQIVFIKQLGLGTAFAVGLDATVVRCLLLPASMILLGKWNWWLPWKTAGVDRSALTHRPAR